MPKKKTKVRTFRIKGVPKGTFKLPIQTAVLVPSTTKTSRKISPAVFKRRVAETRRFLSSLFGGFTSIRATGGFLSKRNTIVREKVVAVVAYAEKKGFATKKQKWFRWMRVKKKQWGQEAIGFIIENDLFYL